MSRVTFTGDILSVRTVEDAIRATRKYTEGVQTLRRQHPLQGEDFPSQTFYKYYEVSPDIDLNKRLSVTDAGYKTFDWLWGKGMINVYFWYNYPTDKAKMVVKDGWDAVKVLVSKIPSFALALRNVVENIDEDDV